ncbi:hypothetical protein AB1Y20_006923 [Prymnesium parvum]|uniref:Protein SDA1 n=1 Tax=Prymnesium parvum TaxID=97485 RepID=A0AB34J354_PRYPA
MGKRKAKPGGAAEAEEVYHYAADDTAKPKRKTGRKSIAKLSRKQKLRKQAKVVRAETLADRAEVKAHRDTRKTAFRLKAKSLW